MKNLILILMFFAFNLFPAQQGDAPMGNTNLGPRPQLAEDDADHPAKRQKLESKEEKSEKAEAQKPEADEKEKKEKAENINIKVVKSPNPNMQSKTIDINDDEPITSKPFKELIEEKLRTHSVYILARAILKNDPEDKSRSFYDAHALNEWLFPEYSKILPSEQTDALLNIYRSHPLRTDPSTRSEVERVEYYIIDDINKPYFEYMANNSAIFDVDLLLVFYKNYYSISEFINLLQNYIKTNLLAAKKTFEEVISLNKFPPLIQFANYGLGIIYNKIGDQEAAKKYFLNALKEPNPDIQMLSVIRLAEINLKQNNVKESIKYLLIAEKSKKNLDKYLDNSTLRVFDAYVYPTLAMIFFNNDNFKKAKEYYELILKEDKVSLAQKSRALFNLGQIYFLGFDDQKLDFKKAFDLYKELFGYDNPDALYYKFYASLGLGQMYHYGKGVEKDLPKAKEYYNFAINQNKNIDAKNRAQKELDALNNVNQQAQIS